MWEYHRAVFVKKSRWLRRRVDYELFDIGDLYRFERYVVRKISGFLYLYFIEGLVVCNAFRQRHRKSFPALQNNYDACYR